MSVLGWFRARSDRQRQATVLYGAVVAQARQPAFYRSYGVPDTQQGRYEMLVLVLFQLLERLRASPEHGELSRLVLESLFTDVDDNMREIGIGDLSVPKKVKRAAAGFYERTIAYRAALAAADQAELAAHLRRFVAGDRGAADPAGAAGAAGVDATRLARFAIAQHEALAAAPVAEVVEGRAFLAPENVAA